MAGKRKETSIRGLKRQRRLLLSRRHWSPSPVAILSTFFFLCLLVSTAYFSHTLLNLKNDNSNDSFLPRQHSQEDDPILGMLSEAGMDLHKLNLTTIPTWKNVQDWYGDPVIVGLDTCETYQTRVPLNRRIVAPAGMFHSGTNVLASLLHSNCYFNDNHNSGGKVAWQVPWGKHVLASMREDHSVGKTDNDWDSSSGQHVHTLPIVMIRDPYLWMERMCIQPYAAKWHHKTDLHCPNLVPTKEEYEQVFSFREPHVPVRIKFGTKNEQAAVVWDSLVHLWSDWYQQYLTEMAYPRLMVRLEDLMFRPKATISKICTCAGGTFEGRSDQFYFVKGSAKFGPGHANQYTSWVGTMQEYYELHHSYRERRPHGMTTEDYAYARQHLDEQLMELFHYQHPSENFVNDGTSGTLL